MRRNLMLCFMLVGLSGLLALPSQAQEKFTGRWEGVSKSPQGERPTTATFKKEGDAYSGTITGMRGEMPLKEVKVEGDKLTAKAEVETPNGALTINYSFTLQGDNLNGSGALEFNGTPFSFEVELKRSGAPASPNASANPAGNAAGRTARSASEQPQQKQSLDYFSGAWSFKYIGRESALWPAPREGVVRFTKQPDGQFVGALQGSHEGGAYQESWLLRFDEASKSLSLEEKLASGVTLKSQGDWSSPIAIRFTVPAVKVKGQTLQLRRTLSIVSESSFTVTEELSEDGGPTVRLGRAVFSKTSGQ